MPDPGSDVATPSAGAALRRPVIAVPWPKADYLEALSRAGASPRVVDPARDRVPDVLNGCDGLLLTGGADIDPARYTAAPVHPTVTIDPARDEYELALTRAALARDLPILAICRGVQVLNVAAGGTLVQDVPSEMPSALPHRPDAPPDAIAHDVALAEGTTLARLLAGAPTIGVNSRHHQAVAAVAPGFRVTATAPDGVIEAIERPDGRFCLGVQWHPENFWRTGTFAALFDGFVQAARRPARTP